MILIVKTLNQTSKIVSVYTISGMK